MNPPIKNLLISEEPRWRHQIAAWHASHITNGSTEVANNLIKLVKRGAFGFTSVRKYQVLSLLDSIRPR